MSADEDFIRIEPIDDEPEPQPKPEPVSFDMSMLLPTDEPGADMVPELVQLGGFTGKLDGILKIKWGSKYYPTGDVEPSIQIEGHDGPEPGVYYPSPRFPVDLDTPSIFAGKLGLGGAVADSLASHSIIAFYAPEQSVAVRVTGDSLLLQSIDNRHNYYLYSQLETIAAAEGDLVEYDQWIGSRDLATMAKRPDEAVPGGPVYSPVDGYVVLLPKDSNPGFVTIHADDGSFPDLCEISDITVEIGQRVEKGQQIGVAATLDRDFNIDDSMPPNVGRANYGAGLRAKAFFAVLAAERALRRAYAEAMLYDPHAFKQVREIAEQEGTYVAGIMADLGADRFYKPLTMMAYVGLLDRQPDNAAVLWGEDDVSPEIGLVSRFKLKENQHENCWKEPCAHEEFTHITAYCISYQHYLLRFHHKHGSGEMLVSHGGHVFNDLRLAFGWHSQEDCEEWLYGMLQAVLARLPSQPITSKVLASTMAVNAMRFPGHRPAASRSKAQAIGRFKRPRWNSLHLGEGAHDE